jgi:pyruvate/2-oxoglutarate dehydrogenase complex dihydrolipoamide dehydrogenase (E3) component
LGENVSNPEEYDVVVLGSRVTVVDRNDALAHREDRDVSEALRGLFDDDRTSVNDNLPPKGYRTTVNTRQNGGIVSATSRSSRHRASIVTEIDRPGVAMQPDR